MEMQFFDLLFSKDKLSAKFQSFKCMFQIRGKRLQRVINPGKLAEFFYCLEDITQSYVRKQPLCSAQI